MKNKTINDIRPAAASVTLVVIVKINATRQSLAVVSGVMSY